MLLGLRRDLVVAFRSLLRAPAFTFVCVVSLGIGMTPVIAIPYASRLSHVPPPGVNTAGLVEVLTTTNGPHMASAQWSYPDFQDLRSSITGVTLIGWAGAQSEITFPSAGTAPLHASTIFVSANYFKTLGVALAQGTG